MSHMTDPLGWAIAELMDGKQHAKYDKYEDYYEG